MATYLYDLQFTTYFYCGDGAGWRWVGVIENLKLVGKRFWSSSFCPTPHTGLDTIWIRKKNRIRTDPSAQLPYFCTLKHRREFLTVFTIFFIVNFFVILWKSAAFYLYKIVGAAFIKFFFSGRRPSSTLVSHLRDLLGIFTFHNFHSWREKTIVYLKNYYIYSIKNLKYNFFSLCIARRFY